MVSYSSIFRKACLGFSLAVLLTACVDKSKYEMSTPIGEESVVKVPNSFDFSTVQKVNLSIDYSAIKTYGPVFFGIYTENPFIIQEDAPDDLWNENVKNLSTRTIQKKTESSMKL